MKTKIKIDYGQNTYWGIGLEGFSEDAMSQSIMKDFNNKDIKAFRMGLEDGGVLVMSSMAIKNSVITVYKGDE